jgi:hypothetical protein
MWKSLNQIDLLLAGRVHLLKVVGRVPAAEMKRSAIELQFFAPPAIPTLW